MKTPQAVERHLTVAGLVAVWNEGGTCRLTVALQHTLVLPVVSVDGRCGVPVILSLIVAPGQCGQGDAENKDCQQAVSQGLRYVIGSFFLLLSKGGCLCCCDDVLLRLLHRVVGDV